MRTKRFLLVTAALSTVACGKDPAKKPEVPDAGEMVPLPGNPKGSRYDDDADSPPPPPPPPPPADAGTGTTKPPPPHDAGTGPIKHRLPANPKGSHYDAGKRKPPEF